MKNFTKYELKRLSASLELYGLDRLIVGKTDEYKLIQRLIDEINKAVRDEA